MGLLYRCFYPGVKRNFGKSEHLPIRCPGQANGSRERAPDDRLHASRDPYAAASLFGTVADGFGPN